MAGGRIDIEVEPDLRGFDSKLGAGLRRSSGAMSTVAKGLGLAVAAGTTVAAVGLGKVIQLGNDYQSNLNEMQSVSQATGAQMAQVGRVAKDLGSDMTLPATSAADAAAAMVELSKGGLSVTESMDAAKGTLQLAAAAQVDGAQAAELQANALNSFGLEADQAGRVADVLANTANAAAGSIVDIGNSLKYVAPVSAALKISIEDTASAIGLLANQGIKGEQAGTSLRGILASLSSPSKAAAAGLAELGVKAFDAQGKFVGLRTFTEQLATAKRNLTDAEFAAAASTAFGNEGLTAANALAAEGAAGFDEMAKAVGRSGGAADVAAAQTKGLGGAWEGFKSQLETGAIEVYEVIAPSLEQAVRAGADFIADLTPTVTDGLRTAVSAGQLFGPDLARALTERGDAVLGVAEEILEPLGDAIVDSLNSVLNLGITVFEGFTDVVKEGADAVQPLAEGIGDVVESVNRADGPVAALGTGLGLVYDGAAGLINILSPIIDLVGGLVSGFSDLPGPVQTAVAAMIALKVGPPILNGLKNAFGGAKTEAGEAGRQTGLLGRSLGAILTPVRLAASGIGGVVGTVRQFNGEARVQRQLAAASGVEIGRLGGAVAAFNTSAIPGVVAARGFAEQTGAIRAGAAAAGTPISLMGAAIGTLVERSSTLSTMRDAFTNAASGAARFSRTAGLAAASAVGLRAAAGGLLAIMGGPLGLALAAVSVGLSIVAGNQAEAEAEAEAHRSAVNSLAQALRDAAEAGESISATLKEELSAALIEEFDGAADAAEHFGYSVNEVVDAVAGGGAELDAMKERLTRLFAADPFGEQGKRAGELLKAIAELESRTNDAAEANRRYAEVADGSLLGATDTGKELADAMGILADNTATADDRARALKEALDALSGGQINLEQAQSRLNQKLADLRDLFGENLEKADGWGKALLNADGSINTVLPNGQKLLDLMTGLGEDMATVSQRTFDAAVKQGDDLPTALAKAQKAAQNTRDAFVAQADEMGLTAEEAEKLADRYGLIPEQVATLINSPGMDETQVELILLKSLVDKVPPNKAITVQSLSDAAKKKLQDLGFTVRELPDGRVAVTANTQRAKDALDNYIRNNSGRELIVNVTSRFVNRPGGKIFEGADGGIVAAAYAAGGVHRKLTPMKAGIAQIVPPNTWRVIGDRLRGDEFYLPDDDDPRSMAIGAEWARRRGLQLVRAFATGGIASTTPTTAAQAGRSVSISMPVQVQDNRSAAEFARVASAEIAWQQRFAG